MKYAEIADVLDAVAAYVDEQEAQKTAALTEAVGARVNKIAASFVNATGEEIDADLRNKLAQLDPSTLDQLLKVANTNSVGNPESLGGPADISDKQPPTSVKEAAAQADDRFLQWIIQ